MKRLLILCIAVMCVVPLASAYVKQSEQTLGLGEGGHDLAPDKFNIVVEQAENFSAVTKIVYTGVGYSGVYTSYSKNSTIDTTTVIIR